MGFPEYERSCSACGHPLKQIGKKFLYEELEIIPQQVRVIKYYSATYACGERDYPKVCVNLQSVNADMKL